ncbi:hypothetical protein BLA29_005239 [Euroglyphus maynei]|uniref:Leucine rich repeat containing protein n=1 Tax=Euroglyphus maynei TaxID=6958 RepID=A0A1Y3B0W5_EURMA|nr:hypothetical protein BLA29_005239 [Euroglyphus maynei]
MRKSQSVTTALSSTSGISSMRQNVKNANKFNKIDGSECVWNMPSLEELYLQDNQLECLPSSLFQQPELKILDLSNNKLRTLPPLFWFSPKLNELNLSMNLLCDLPSPIRHQEILLSVQCQKVFQHQMLMALQVIHQQQHKRKFLI